MPRILTLGPEPFPSTSHQGLIVEHIVLPGKFGEAQRSYNYQGIVHAVLVLPVVDMAPNCQPALIRHQQVLVPALTPNNDCH